MAKDVLITEVSRVGLMTMLDFIVFNFIIIRLEEKVLLYRFGAKYLPVNRGALASYSMNFLKNTLFETMLFLVIS